MKHLIGHALMDFAMVMALGCEHADARTAGSPVPSFRSSEDLPRQSRGSLDRHSPAHRTRDSDLAKLARGSARGDHNVCQSHFIESMSRTEGCVSRHR